MTDEQPWFLAVRNNSTGIVIRVRSTYVLILILIFDLIIIIITFKFFYLFICTTLHPPKALSTHVVGRCIFVLTKLAHRIIRK